MLYLSLPILARQVVVAKMAGKWQLVSISTLEKEDRAAPVDRAPHTTKWWRQLKDLYTRLTISNRDGPNIRPDNAVFFEILYPTGYRYQI
jgi:hypothetical protein